MSIAGAFYIVLNLTKLKRRADLEMIGYRFTWSFLKIIPVLVLVPVMSFYFFSFGSIQDNVNSLEVQSDKFNEIVAVEVDYLYNNTQDLTKNFLIIDIVNSLLNKEVLITSSDNITRDYITPSDFFNLVQKIITFGQLNVAFDCYTKAPVNKLELLAILEREFSLTYNIKDNIGKQNVDKLKMNYFSEYKLAETIGYFPQYNSIDGVLKELNILFASKV